MKRSPLGQVQPVGGWWRAVGGVGIVAITSLVVIYFVGGDSGSVDDTAATTVTSVVHDPAATADEFLAAWAAADWATVERVVGDPEAGATAVLADWWRDLEASSVRHTADSPQLGEGMATVAFHTTVEVAGAGSWEYDSALRLTMRGGSWKVVWSPDIIHPKLARGDRLQLTTVWQPRALVTDGDGRPLVKRAPQVIVGLIPERVTSRDVVAAVLAETLAVPRSRVDSVLDQKGVQPDWFLPVSTMSREDSIDLRPILHPIAGIAFRLTDSRVPVESQLAAPLIGSAGEITAEQLTALGDPYVRGLEVGRSGLEQSFERQLAGTPSTQIVRRSLDGSTEVIATLPGTAPAEVRTTLSLDIQRAAENVLKAVELPASIVAIDAAGGQIRAAASSPHDGFSRATSGLYPPGSTFKIIVAAALLESGWQPDDTVACPPVVDIAGREFGNAASLPTSLTLQEAFAQSCNTAFIQLAAELDPIVLSDTATKFGFGTRIDIGLPAADATFDTSADPVLNASSAIGQGQVLASPLNMASVAATAATGTWQPPTLVVRDPSDVGEALDPAVVANLQAMMRSVVQAGTGREADVAGLAVAGKTGTAQVVTADGPSTVAWFIGYSDGLAFAIAVEGGDTGGSTAAPLAAAFLAEIADQGPAPSWPECVPAGADWLTFQGDGKRSGCSGAATITKPKKLWQAEVGISGWLNSPIVIDDLVVIGSAGTRRSGTDDGDGVYALSLRNGKRKWFFQADNDVNGLAASGDVVVATGDEGSVWGLDLATGSQLWTFATEAPVFTNPLIVGDLVIVGDSSGLLWALGLDGTERWRAQFDGAIRGGAASDGQMIYAVSEHGDAAAFTADGFEMWRTRITHRATVEPGGQEAATVAVTVFAAPTVADDKVIIPFGVDGGPTTPAVVALDRFVGTVVWRGGDPNELAEDFSNVRGSPARFRDSLILGSSLSEGVQALDAESGLADWVSRSGTVCEKQWASPVVVGDLVLLPRPDGALHAYDAAGGEFAWKIPLAGPSEVARLAQCDADTQQIQEGFELQASIAVAPNGTVIVASTSQWIYAIVDS